jgi:hypothetical protein
MKLSVSTLTATSRTTTLASVKDDDVIAYYKKGITNSN